jgi:hypothetical protein
MAIIENLIQITFIRNIPRIKSSSLRNPTRKVLP